MHEQKKFRARQARGIRPPLVVKAALLAASACCPPLSAAQNRAPADSVKLPILEVVEISGPEWRSYRYLYLRVFPDGTLEFQDPMKIDLTKEIPLFQKKLSDQEMSKLESALNSQEMRGLSGTYEKENTGNIRSVFMIEIARNEGRQALEFVNFDSRDAMEGGRSYTPDAERFGTLIKKVREQARDKPPIESQSRQLTAQKASDGVILEVVATDYQAYTQTKYILARVYEDGKVEYHDALHMDLLYPAMIHKHLPPQDVAQLKKILGKTEIRELNGEYHGWYGVDTSVRWDFLVPNGDRTQKFVLLNFTYPERWVPDNTRMIPKEANELGCFLLGIDEQSLHFSGMPERCKEAAHPK